MKRNNLFLTIAALIATILISIFISIGNCQTSPQDEYPTTSQETSNQEETIYAQSPIQQSIPINVQILKTNVNNVDDGTITSKIKFYGSVSGGVYISLLDENENSIPGYFQQEAFVLNDGVYVHGNFIVPEGVYKLKITNGGDDFITSEIIIRGKNEVDAPSFDEKPSISVPKDNTFDDTTGHYENDAEIYTDITLSWDRDIVEVNYVDAILYNESNNAQIKEAEQNIDNFSVTFENLPPSKYNSEFVVNYTNKESGITKESYSNSSFLVQSYEVEDNPDAPKDNDVEYEVIKKNDYNETTPISEVKISVSILEKQLPMTSVLFKIDNQTLSSEVPIEDPTEPTRTLYSATFFGIADGNHTYSSEGSYLGGTTYSEGKFDMWSDNTPLSTATLSEEVIIKSLPGKQTGKIDLYWDVSTYSTIQENTVPNTNPKLKNAAGDIVSEGSLTEISSKSGTGDREVVKYIKLSFDGLAAGTYDLDYEQTFNDNSSCVYECDGIQVEDFASDVPSYVDVQISSTNSTWNKINGKINTKIMLDDTYISDYSIKTEVTNTSTNITKYKIENTTGFEGMMEKTIGDLPTGEYSVTVNISKNIDEVENSNNWNLVAKEYLTITEDARLKPSVNTITGDLVQSDYLEDNGGIKNIEVTFIDQDLFIDEVYFEVTSGGSLIQSEQATQSGDKWIIPEGIMFTDLKPLNYSFSVKTILLDSSTIETPYLFKIEEKPNPESMTDSKIVWIIVGVCAGIVLIGGALGYYFVRIK